MLRTSKRAHEACARGMRTRCEPCSEGGVAVGVGGPRLARATLPRRRASKPRSSSFTRRAWRIFSYQDYHMLFDQVKGP